MREWISTSRSFQRSGLSKSVTPCFQTWKYARLIAARSRVHVSYVKPVVIVWKSESHAFGGVPQVARDYRCARMAIRYGAVAEATMVKW